MLTHIVCWKYKPETSEAERQGHIASLRALVGVVAEIRSFTVGSDILNLQRSFDTGLVATFDDRDALDRYTEHPEHQRVAALGRELSQQTVSVDFVDE